MMHLKNIKIQPEIYLSLNILLIIILGFLIYSNSLRGRFIWDDLNLVVNNEYLRNWPYLPKIFTQDIAGGGGKNYYFYRPLQVLSYMIDYSLWRLDARGFHLTNIMLHILVTLGIYWLVSTLTKNKFLPLLTSILFLVHPIHTEAVSYISGRADSLATLFMVLCFISYIKQDITKNPLLFISMLLFYSCALLSKENSLIFPAVLILYHYTFRKKIKFHLFFSLTGLVLIYILLRITFLKYLLVQIPHSNTWLERLPGFFVAITEYIKLLFLPFRLHMEYGDKLFTWINPRTISGLVISVSLTIYALRERKRNGLLSFSILWFFLLLLPYANIYPINAYMAEHFLYISSLGFFLALSIMFRLLYVKFRIITVVFSIGLVSFYSFLTIKQNEYWREPLSFYQRTLDLAPDSARLHDHVGNVYRDDKGNYKMAIDLIKKP